MLTVNANFLNEIALSHKSKVGGKNYHLVMVSLGAVFTKLWRPQLTLSGENVGFTRRSLYFDGEFLGRK